MSDIFFIRFKWRISKKSEAILTMKSSNCRESGPVPECRHIEYRRIWSSSNKNKHQQEIKMESSEKQKKKLKINPTTAAATGNHVCLIDTDTPIGRAIISNRTDSQTHKHTVICSNVQTLTDPYNKHPSVHPSIYSFIIQPSDKSTNHSIHTEYPLPIICLSVSHPANNNWDL